MDASPALTHQQLDSLTWDAGVLLWMSLVMTGVLLWELITQLPADVKYVLYPEFRRSVLPPPLATLALGATAGTTRRAAAQRWWQRPREKRQWPHIPAICLLLARLFTIPCCAVTIAFCRRTSNCTATARAYLFCVALAKCVPTPGETFFLSPLRCVAFTSRPLLAEPLLHMHITPKYY